MANPTAPALRIPRFKTGRPGVCGSDYVCDDFEIGDHVGVLAGPNGPVTLCASCCERTEAAAELADLDPTLRVDDPAPAGATTVAEAVEALRTEHSEFGQYTDESVAVLLALVDNAAEQAAARERGLWVDRLRRMARRGTDLTDGAVAGIHMAASLIRRNRET